MLFVKEANFEVIAVVVKESKGLKQATNRGILFARSILNEIKGLALWSLPGLCIGVTFAVRCTVSYTQF